MAVMKNVAALAGVSTATVSHVLSGKKRVSEDVRRRVLDAIALTNYTPNTIAKSLRTNRTRNIGVLVEDICAYPVPDIVDGVSEYLEGKGYQLLLNNLHLLGKLYNHYEQLTQYKDIVNDGVRLMTRTQVDGIIYVSMHDRRIDNVIMPVNKPLVYAYAYSSNEPSVTYDNEASSEKITQVLIDHGHTRIALICGHAASTPVKLRLKGYRNALDKTGIEVPPEYIRWGNWEFESGVKQTECLLNMPLKPTAIVAMNDLMAAGCYSALQRGGLRIPDDISIVGFDNREISSYLYPPLTTLALPHKEIGRRAGALMLSRLEGQDISNVVIPCDVVRRDSIRTVPLRSNQAESSHYRIG